MTTTFTPGDAVGVCGPTAHLVAGIKLDDPRLPRLWEVLSRGDSAAGAGVVDGVLEVLLEGGFASMPAFAIAATSGTSTRVVVRHPAVVEATVDGTAVSCTSTPGGTWSDVTVEGASVVDLRAGADAATTVRLPFHAGMTPASSVRVVLDADAPVAPAAAAPDVQHDTVAGHDTSDVSPRAEVSITEAEAPLAEPEPIEATPHTAIWKGHEGAAEAPADDPAPTTPEATESSDAPEAADGTAEPAEAEASSANDEPASDAAPDTPAPVETTPEPTDEPDGSTVLRPALPKSVPAPPAPPAPAPPAPPAAPASAPQAPPSRGLIDGVPWLNADWSAASSTPAQPKPAYETPSRPAPPAPPVRPTAPAPPAPPASTPTAAGTSDEEDGDDAPTVLRAELVKELGSAGIVGPSVLAVDCPNGHQTSAHEPTCRLCKAPVGDSQEPRQIPRPPLGALVLANGDRLVLDKDAVLGRAPHEPEGSAERPHLLRVGDNGDISRQHARIILDDWHVIVRDLGTANGTTLTLPGGSPQQLRANEDYQLEDGAEIGIADVVTLRYEVKP